MIAYYGRPWLVWAMESTAKRTRKPGGRGTRLNPVGRFEPYRYDNFDDGWNVPGIEPETPSPGTRFVTEIVRGMISKNDSPDIPFERSINPYRGCEHGCVYCYARPSHAYMGLSPGLDFETQIFIKENGPEQLRREFRRKSYRPEPIAIGGNTDPYQPIERLSRVTRRVLEICLEHRHPLYIITKSALILRDLDLLAELARLDLVRATLSVTTLNPELAHRLEPRASTPARRLEAIRQLSRAGVRTNVLMAPVIPALNEDEIEGVLDACRRAGAATAGYVLLRLPHEVKDLFSDWLHAHYPERADRVLQLVRNMRGGKLYDSAPGLRMKGTGTHAELIRRRFQIAARRFRLNQALSAPTSARFRNKPEVGRQLSMF